MLGPGDYALVPVVEAWDETRAFRGIRLAIPPELSQRHMRPGQVVKVRSRAGEGFFALATAPHPAGVAELLVKRGAGPIADATIETAAPGGALEMTRPFGNGFPIEEAEGRDLLLFAAGSGIAPIRAVVQHVEVHRSRFGRVTLFYGQRSGSEFAYRAEYIGWERHGVRVVLCPSRDIDAWPGVRGRVQEVARSLAFGGSPPGESVAFVSGMTAMVDDVRRTLAAAGVPADRVHANL